VVLSSLKTDCHFFKGWAPCQPHKEHGVHCVEPDGTPCPYHEPLSERILIIKLGAVGDVIRTTPLLHKFRERPGVQIWWLTLTPEVLPAVVDVPLPLTVQSVSMLHTVPFSLLINLDKDPEACALALSISAKIKKGFIMRDGIPAPVDKDAVHKFMTGLFDDVSKANTKSYPQEIFEIAGLTFRGERYILDSHAEDGYHWKFPKRRKIIGLNTGCGGRWISRLWPDKNWINLARQLKKAGLTPLLLGGEQEHGKNKRIAKLSGALYLGHFPLRQFINLVDQCDLVVTAVTMAMHVTIGLGKKIVLFNNIFNRHEFELYGLGEILEPEIPCTCYFSPVCPNNCMQYIYPEKVFAAITRILSDPS
jgi:ADP-heptose:LPS heptosyltransferase